MSMISRPAMPDSQDAPHFKLWSADPSLLSRYDVPIPADDPAANRLSMAACRRERG